MSTDFDLDGWLDDAALPERTVEVCLRGDLLARLEDLERQAEAADTPGMMNSPAAAIVREIEALQEQMRASTKALKLRALPRTEYTKLESAHPVRKDNDADKRCGWNSETFPEALIRRCLVEPTFTDAQWARFVDRLTQAQYDRIGVVALELNKRDVSVPFSFAASRIRQNSGDESRRLNGSESASDGSTGGNRAERRRTSTTKKGASSGR